MSSHGFVGSSASGQHRSATVTLCEHRRRPHVQVQLALAAEPTDSMVTVCVLPAESWTRPSTRGGRLFGDLGGIGDVWVMADFEAVAVGNPHEVVVRQDLRKRGWSSRWCGGKCHAFNSMC